jgi:Cu+-exporting ATPase
LGLHVLLVSDAPPAVTAGVAREVTFDQVLPGVPQHHVPQALTQLRKRGSQIAWVGAGAGQTDSLAAADVGIALNVGGWVDAAAADVILPGDLRGVGRAILLSRAIVGTIRTNLGFALAYNALLIPLAAISLLPPVLAAAATTVAGTAVIANSLLLLRRRID